MTRGSVASAVPDDGDIRLATETESWPEFDLTCRVEEYEDGDHCTVFPADADDDELVTTWLTAEGDAFVDLETVR
ncbi:DUF7511 domain-containing protein [Halarchaeum sp. P4]|uniref:DUF7511 domain-containing protein n=1 Tax=Halarchaeum sp. P4 TaxID=3421639 RepID=UPI003EBD6D74